MSIFDFTRKTDTVSIGNSKIVLTEPSALERLAFGERLSAGYKEGATASETLKAEVEARIYLIVDCISYSMSDANKESIAAEVSALPPEELNVLSKSALVLSGQWIEEEEEEKKSQTPEQ